MDSVVFGCHEVCVIKEILALKYCSPVVSLLKKKAPSLCSFLLTVNTLLGGLRQSYFQKMVFFKDFLHTQEVVCRRKKGEVADF